MGPQSAVDREFVYIDFFLFCVCFGSCSFFLLLSSFFLHYVVLDVPTYTGPVIFADHPTWVPIEPTICQGAVASACGWVWQLRYGNPTLMYFRDGPRAL